MFTSLRIFGRIAEEGGERTAIFPGRGGGCGWLLPQPEDQKPGERGLNKDPERAHVIGCRTSRDQCVRERLAKRLLLVEGAVPTIRCKETDTVTGCPPRRTRVAMSRRRWSEEDGEFTLGGAREGLRSKPRFSFTELRVLLDAVKKNRYILLKKFNQGVPAEDKKRTWTDITNQVNCLGENHRQVRQIMKKWADLKCDGKRRIAAMRGPNGSSVRKKGLGPVEKMVHKILKLSPNRDVDSDSDLEGAELYKRYGRGPAPYLSLTDSPPGGAAFDISPLSSPEKDIGDQLQSSSEVDLAEDGDVDSDSDLEGAELYKRYGRGPAPYLSLTDSPPGGAAFDISPLSSPEKDIGDQLQSSSEVDLAEDGGERAGSRFHGVFSLFP
ncbi:unnamed protein product [Menidia menidia]|uniref:(Atlantic silverside) hypothetical protein n=1 Tax=Menidia menidia TaxID=238744 RepID=A0A8S4BSV2_9TELE|nr:unnamed protein product [Menidia menidia]